MNEYPEPRRPTRRVRALRSDGERSRRAILHEAARLATIEGLAGLSIAGLADAVGMSKSGLFAHFASKEELQLATVEATSAGFMAQVVEPAAGAGGGRERLRLLVEGYLRYLDVDTFPGGCFFASALAEVDMQPGPVRDRLVLFFHAWVDRLAAAVRDAQLEGDIDAHEDPDQLAFEVQAVLMYANAAHVVARTSEPIDRARRAIDRRLADAAPSAPRAGR